MSTAVWKSVAGYKENGTCEVWKPVAWVRGVHGCWTGPVLWVAMTEDGTSKPRFTTGVIKLRDKQRDTYQGYVHALDHPQKQNKKNPYKAIKAKLFVEFLSISKPHPEFKQVKSLRVCTWVCAAIRSLVDCWWVQSGRKLDRGGHQIRNGLGIRRCCPFRL